MAYDYDEDATDVIEGDCACKLYGSGNGVYIDSDGKEQFCFCAKGVALKFKRGEFLRKREGEK